MRIIGPHLGFQGQSNLGGERFEHIWIHSQTENEFYWLIPADLSKNLTAPGNHQLIPVARTSGIFRWFHECFLLLKHGKRQSADILRFHSVIYGTPVAILLRLFGCRLPILFQHHHVEETDPRYRIFIKAGAIFRFHYCCVSKFSENELLHLGIKKENLHTVLNILPGPSLTKDTASVPNSAVFVGSLIPRKNPMLALNAIELLASNHSGEKFLLNFIGKGELHQTIVNHKTPGNLSVVVNQNAKDDIKNELLAKSKIFLFPSSTEGFGYSPLEAALAGIWVFCSDIPVLREVLGDFPNVTFVPSGGWADENLLERIYFCLKNDPPGIPARLREKFCSIEPWAKAHKKILESLRR